MRIVGEWFLCTDGEIRPVVTGYAGDATGGEVQVQFLVDTGADRTVFTAGLLQSLSLPSSAPPAGFAFAGVGGKQAFVLVGTTLTLYAEDGSPARIERT